MRFAVACPLLLALLLPLPAAAQALYAGNTIAYQGRLEHDGQPVAHSVSMTFRFYASEASSTELGSFTASVTPVDGAFAVNLGPLPDAVFAANDLWLAIDVDGAALGGRQRVIPSARAARADTASELTVTGTAVVVGNTASNDLEIGHMGHAGWAGVAHTDAAGPNSYALMQNASGSETLLNAAPNGQVKIRTGNTDRVTVSSNGNLNVTGGATVNGSLDVNGQTLLGYVRRQCDFPDGAEHADCQCAANERVISGGTYVEPVQNQPGHLEGFIHHRKGFWVRESRPLDDFTWRVACMEIQYLSTEGESNVFDLEVRRSDCGPIDIICARVGN